jgi:DNA mismatch repair protein MutS2
LNFYPKNTLEKLDFPFILGELDRLCAGTLGRHQLQRQSFTDDIDTLSYELQCVKELKESIENDTAIPQYGFNQLGFLNKLTIQHYHLDVKELIELYYALSAVADLFRYFTPQARQKLYPSLAKKVSAYNLDLTVITAITDVIDIEKAIVRENASPELRKIRKQLNDKIQEINSVFRRVVAQYKNQQVLAETEETIRDGRRVLSVRSEYKRSIKGLITDESDNGNITYIEPHETIFLNNELSELYLDERREILKILTELTAEIQPHKPVIESLQQLMAELDVIRAKAYFALNYKCNVPVLTKERRLFLHDFVHPVLYHHHSRQHKPVVENTIQLDEKGRIMVISGPNAGGKSIILKSVGIIQLMLQFGMMIPAKENSVMCVFTDLFVDIGDEQSIENDLSTYSSHLSNMHYFLTHAGAKSLVLMDETGMGTDPALGGPMAEAILEELHKKKVFGVVTTHFNNIKVFAANTPFMQSGAMAFDTKQLKPLFQLQTGQPGSSFTFEIASKSGLPDHIIKSAQQKTGENKKVLDEVLGDIQVEKQFIKGLRKNVQAKESQLQDLTKSYEQLNKELEKEKKRLLKQYESRLLERFNMESRALENEMRAWKEQKGEKSKFIEVRNYIDDHRADIEKKLDDTASAVTANSGAEIKIGSKVKLEEGAETGEVLEIKNNMALVVFGNIQTKVNVQHLVAAGKETRKPEPARNAYSSKLLIEKSEFDYNLDLRGLMKDEAITALDNFMDKAIMYGMSKIKIIHGRGTGALKQAVQYYLKQYPHVKQFYFENEQFGGDGITIVEMK